MHQLPLFVPDSDWVAPTSLPDIPSGVDLAVDTETRDEGLSNNQGPGWVRRAGHIAGVSVAWNHHTYYIPVNHPETPCFDMSVVGPWLQDAMLRANRIIFHNQAYDQGWLSVYDVTIPVDKTDDTYAMSVMVDENRDSYSLDASCRWRGVKGKDEYKLREAAAAYGLDAKSDMWRLPARYVALYAAQDAKATLELAQNLLKEITKEGLEEAYRLEIDLIPMVLEMRRRGIRIDESKADQTQKILSQQRDEVLRQLKDKVSWNTMSMEHLMSPVSLAKLFEEQNLTYPRTPKTNKGSFDSQWMKQHSHWLPQMVAKARVLDQMSEKFIGIYIKNSIHLGRIHAEVHQLRDDNGGTRSYRFSYSDPPLQQIPAKGEMGGLIRSLFLPEKDGLWLAADYSQQEPRIAVHFAALCRCDGAEAALDYYNKDPSADFHTMVSELTGVSRGRAKILNLGLMYGMGLTKLANSLGVSLEEGKDILSQYHGRMPFVQSLNNFCKKRADTRGYIRLLDGARSRFELWERAYNKKDTTYSPPCPLEQARGQWPNERIRRAFTHKAMNRLIQGSAARQTKLAMREFWRNGIVPLLQMHDEIDCSVETEKAGNFACEIMKNVINLKVPMKVDGAYGHTWGQAAEEPPKGITAPSFSEIMAADRQDTVEQILARR